MLEEGLHLPAGVSTTRCTGREMHSIMPLAWARPRTCRIGASAGRAPRCANCGNMYPNRALLPCCTRRLCRRVLALQAGDLIGHKTCATDMS